MCLGKAIIATNHPIASPGGTNGSVFKQYENCGAKDDRKCPGICVTALLGTPESIETACHLIQAPEEVSEFTLYAWTFLMLMPTAPSVLLRPVRVMKSRRMSAN
jgi:hypothetical protein